MLDYHAHIAALNAANSSVLAMNEPQLAQAQAAAADALDQHPDIARLGSLLDAILFHGESDGLELELLRKASKLWERSLKIYNDLETAKIEFELSLVRTDLPDAVNVLQLGINHLYDVSQACGEVIKELKAMHDAIAPLDYLKPHPRQSDKPSSEWSWGDAFLGRRTFALVRSLFANANNARSTAFAMGALGGYAGNTAGSAFLGSVVGGPRRLHRFRDRLARNTLGAFMHQHGATPPLAELSELLRLGGDHHTPALPQDLANQLRTALGEAYPSRMLPNLDLGYQRMLEHLQLLSGFRMPDPPQPPTMPLSADGSIQPTTFDDGFSDPASPPDVSIGGPPDPMVGGGAGLDPGPSSSKSSAGGACLAVLLAIGIFIGVTFVIFAIWCLDRRLREKDCDPGDFLDTANPPPDPRDPAVTHAELTVLREPENCGRLLQNVFQLQMRLWQGFESARAFLTVTGLIYPTAEAMGQQLHRQFLQPRETSAWPRREDPQADKNYHRYPTTPPEQPAIAEVFPSFRPPEWLLHPDPVDNEFAVAQIAIEAFRAVHDLDAPFNLDGDADRAHHHPCWSVSPGTSIADPVLSVDLLLFEEE
jgi:hypothetical protein